MTLLPHSLHGFFFTRVSASGFGFMRILWAGTAFFSFLCQWSDIALYYSNDGVLPRGLMWNVVREMYRLSILDWIESPSMVFAVYVLLLIALLYSMLGIFTRWSTGLSVLLIFAFHERNPLVLGGGETLLRCVGLLLLIAPTISAFSIDRLRMQWRHFRHTLTLLPPLRMSVWPVRLLLWQLIVVYLSSTWWKLLGTMWLSGTAVATVLHHPIYARWPQWMMHLLSPLGPAMTYATIVWEAAWGLLLIPRATVIRVAPSLERFSLKRALLALGILFHGSIFLLLDVGSFFGAMLCAYAGLLTDDDIVAMRRWFASSRGNQKIAVLFDGHCGLCRRSVFVIALCDWLKRVQLVDFWDDGARKSVAPDLTIEELDKALHIRLPGGKTLKGFDALRGLVWHLPALWVTIPLLYLPGAAVVGQWGYANVAERRKKCTHQGCRISPF